MGRPRKKPPPETGADEEMVFQLKIACEAAGLKATATHLNRIVFALERNGYGIWPDSALDGG